MNKEVKNEIAKTIQVFRTISTAMIFLFGIGWAISTVLAKFGMYLEIQEVIAFMMLIAFTLVLFFGLIASIKN